MDNQGVLRVLSVPRDLGVLRVVRVLLVLIAVPILRGQREHGEHEEHRELIIIEHLKYYVSNGYQNLIQHCNGGIVG